MDVRLDKVNKSFGALHVVKDVELIVADKEFITLLGPSGCGKTTLLRMIAGLETVTSGEIRFGERVVNKVLPGQRDVAMVFQNYALYPHMKVFDNIAYGLKVRRTPKHEIRQRVTEVARILEIEHLLERKPRQLSGGQRQRVALGRAMVRNPKIFLMDEPLSNLDAKLRVTMRAELKRFHINLGTTTIYVTHDQLEAMTMSDKVAVMCEGRVQQYGTPQEVYNRPANLFVAGFIGNPPMNFIEGRLARDPRPKLAVANSLIALPDDLAPALADRLDGTPLVLGVRPQDVTLAPPGTPGALPAEVWLVELVGSEKLVDLSYADGKRICAEVRADAVVRLNDRVAAAVDPTRVHLFDPASGLAILD
jgi:ABC-type sugar transport system ATPase subunit